MQYLRRKNQVCLIIYKLQQFQIIKKLNNNTYIHLLYSSVTEIFSPPELIWEVSVLPVEIPCHIASVPPVHKSHQTTSTAPKLLPTSSELLRGHQISSPIQVWELGVPVWSPRVRLLLCSDTVSLQILQLNLTFQTQHLFLLPIPINDKDNYSNDNGI